MLFAFPIIAYASQVVAVAVFALVYRNLPAAMRVLGLYFVLSLIVSTLQLVLALNDVHNLWTLYVFSPVQFLLLTLVYYLSKDLSISRMLTRLWLACYVVLFGSSIAWTGSLARGYPYFEAGGSLLIVIASCYVLIAIARIEEKSYLAKPLFWVASANIVYFAGTAVLFALSGALLETSMQTMRIAWASQSVVNVIAIAIYMKGFWCFRRT